MATGFQAPEKSKTILVADDEPEIRGYLETALRCRGYSVETAPDGVDVVQRIQDGENKFSLVLLDVLMPRKNGLEALRYIRQLDPQLPVIMLSCASSASAVVEAIKSGATDFLPKPISHEDLGTAVEKALASQAPMRFRLPTGSSPSARRSAPPAFMPVKDVEPLLHALGASLVPVLIEGETGTGKEVIARRLHEQSSRAGNAFLKLNCAALPAELVESELFGYERGAFTGAFQRKPGMFELADGGTILLDEIGDMDFRLQSKLLQVLQDNEFQRVGGKQVVQVNVRVIAATHCNLLKAIEEKRFRADLYYRLKVVSIHIPPLRERRDEMIPIAEFLLRKHSQTEAVPRLPSELEHAFLNYSWPGNIRQMENVIRNFILLRDTDLILQELQIPHRSEPSHRDERRSKLVHIPELERTSSSILEKVNEAQKAAETKAILAALNSAGWNRKRAATQLGIDYKALLYKMKKLGISPESLTGNRDFFHNICDSPELSKAANPGRN